MPLVLGLVLVGLLVVLVSRISAPPPLGEPVHLVTGVAEACYNTNWAEGPLSFDPDSGTVIEDAPENRPVPVMWPPGFTARRSGSEVAVLNPDGKVVAMTGRRYRIAGGYVSLEPQLPVRGFWACDFVDPQ